MNFAITKAELNAQDLSRVDPRILQFLKGWKLVEQWEGKDVVIPDYTPINYFEALNKPEGVQDDEKQLTLWCGWAGRSNGKDIDGQYDAELLITISVNGQACHDDTIKQVNVELIKSGGTTMQVYFNGHLVTNFLQVVDFGWFIGKRLVTNGYQTVPDIYKFL